LTATLQELTTIKKYRPAITLYEKTSRKMVDREMGNSNNKKEESGEDGN